MMLLPPALVALILGVVEGITEFLPVSSTGHLIVAGDLLGFTGERAATFEIFIQLGAILAVAWLYRARFWSAARHAAGPEGKAFLLPLFVAFLPVAVVGLALHHWITAHLFTPSVVAAALVIGGVAILLLERRAVTPSISITDPMPVRTALGIGLAQLLSLIPGTSRSAATILGGFALGCTREAATEFSFLLSVPVLGSATLYQLYKGRGALGAGDLPFFAIGTAVSFVVAFVVIQRFLKYVARHDFRVFAWYRIAFGLLLGLFYWVR
ncbi:MAG TPA: undecaprenyl-diphosphate phosphatase [Gemmatimonadales bacterium]|nr:undecaprenyl-diphosphate phosphatase [Gemmatimonadales bacterium]